MSKGITPIVYCCSYKSLFLFAAGHGDKKEVESKLNELHKEFQSLAGLADKRRNALMVTREYFRFVAECEELEQWLLDKQRICQSFKPGRDMVALVALQQKHKVNLFF